MICHSIIKYHFLTFLRRGCINTVTLVSMAFQCVFSENLAEILI